MHKNNYTFFYKIPVFTEINTHFQAVISKQKVALRAFWGEEEDNKGDLKY